MISFPLFIGVIILASVAFWILGSTSAVEVIRSELRERNSQIEQRSATLDLGMIAIKNAIECLDVDDTRGARAALEEFVDFTRRKKKDN